MDQDEYVCAWCHHTYDPITNERGRLLTDEEYAAVQSHGCCKECKDIILRKLKAEKGLL